jgi:hypothetical protein
MKAQPPKQRRQKKSVNTTSWMMSFLTRPRILLRSFSADFGFGEFDVFHVVGGDRGGDEFVILIVDEGAGATVGSHDSRSIEACNFVER